MTIHVVQAEFVAAAEALKSLPAPDLPEIAVLGRSNVGKSTLVNRLTGRRKLARTSATPGRTQQLNFFRVDLLDDERRRSLILVDLPGFGFARFSKDKRQQLSRLTVEYLSSRQSLTGVCLLNDCRRAPERDELAVRDLAFRRDLRLLVVLTKMDKLKQSERAKYPAQIAGAYGLESGDVVMTGERMSMQPLWQRLLQAVD